MRPLTSVFASILVAIAALAGVKAAFAQSAGEWADSADIWRATCGYCHDGALVGPELFERDLSLEVVRDWVRRGNGAMPSFPASEIGEEELQALTEWINRQKPTTQRENAKTQ